jgi:hypothetical protein
MATENGNGRVSTRTQVSLQNEVARWKQRCAKLKAECAKLRRELAIHKERRACYWQIIRDDFLKLKPEDFEVDEDELRAQLELAKAGKAVSFQDLLRELELTIPAQPRQRKPRKRASRSGRT